MLQDEVSPTVSKVVAGSFSQTPLSDSLSNGPSCQVSGIPMGQPHIISGIIFVQA